MNFLNTRADDLLIGYFLGPVTLGYYTIAYRVLCVMHQLLVNTSKQVLLPTFSRLQGDIKLFRNAFYTATQLTSVVAFPIFIGVATLAPELVVLLFGEQWIPSIPIVQILSIAGIFDSISFFKSSVFIAMGKPSWAVWIGLLSTVLNIIGFTIAVQYGIIAVALAYIVRCCVTFPIGQWAVSRLIQVPMLTYLRNFFAPLISSLIIAVAIISTKYFLKNLVNTEVALVICTVTGAILYGLAIRLFAPELFHKLLELVYLALSGSESQRA